MYIQVIITDNLLFHYDLPAWIPWDGVVMIQTVILTQCLQPLSQ